MILSKKKAKAIIEALAILPRYTRAHLTFDSKCGNYIHFYLDIDGSVTIALGNRIGSIVTHTERYTAMYRVLEAY